MSKKKNVTSPPVSSPTSTKKTAQAPEAKAAGSASSKNASTSAASKAKKPAIKEEILIESTEVIREGNVTIVKTETIEIIEVESSKKPAPVSASEAARARIAEGNATLEQAAQHFQDGNYPEARKLLVDLAEKHSSLEIREQATDLLSRMEMDVRTLMVGAVGMVMLLLIPTIGFARALWMVPVLFLILLIDPNLFRAPEQND